MRTTSQKRVALAGAATTLALAGATVALATPPSGQTVTPLARGTLVKPVKINEKVGNGRIKIQTQGALDALAAQQTLAPGGTSGWHKHAGPHITIVMQGVLTIIDAKCGRHELPAGHANIAPGPSVDKVENPGSTPVVFYATFLVPHGVNSPRIDEPAPAGCNA
jgi:quercetin dioxygenase-like cupin family protein